MSILPPGTPVIVIPIAFADYDPPAAGSRARRFKSLPRVENDVALLKQLFESPAWRELGFEVLDPKRAGTAGAILDWLSQIRQRLASQPGCVPILFWTGHGRAVRDDLRLITQECFEPPSGSDGLSPGDVLGKLADAGVGSILVLLDVCQAAAATPALITAAARRAFERPQEHGLGIAALFAAYPSESARDGVFIPMLMRLLRDGPSPEARARMDGEQWEAFNPRNRRLTLQEVEEALLLEVEIEKKGSPSISIPDGVRSGRQIRVFPNPCFRSDARPINVGTQSRLRHLRADMETHFLPRARGLEASEDGWFFTGRLRIGREIVEWLNRKGEAASERLFVITGSGGVGKSAIVGRLVALSDDHYRASARRMGWDEAADTANGVVPPLDGIDAALHLRKLTLTQVLRALSEMLGLDPATAAVDVTAFMAAAPVSRPGVDRPITIVLDALDEADEPGRLASALLRPMAARGWRILVATRRSAAIRDAPDLLALLEPAHVRVLDDEATSDADIREYVRLRLVSTPDSSYAAAPDVANAIAEHIAARAERKFLYARVTASALLRRRVAIQADHLERDIAVDPDDAFRREIDTLRMEFEKRFGLGNERVFSTLSALAYAEGEGLPLRDGIWSRIAAAISGVEGSLTDDHVRWLLSEGGHLIVEDGDGQQPVYRLFHQALADFVRSESNAVQASEAIASALLREARDAGWADVNPYVSRHLAAHLAGLADGAALDGLLLDYGWLATRLSHWDINELLTDFARSTSANRAVAALEGALTQSGAVLARDRSQLPAQLVARLSSTADADLRKTLDAAVSTPQAPWLRPLSSSLAGEQSRRWLRPANPESLSYLSFSRNGEWAVHASWTHGLELWNLRRWRSDGALTRPPTSTFGLALSDDGRHCMFADSVGGVFAWSAREQRTRGGQAHQDLRIASRLAISRDGRLGLSADSWGTLIAWNIDRDEREKWQAGHDRGIRLIAMNSLGTVAIVTCKDNVGEVLDLWPMRRRRRLVLPAEPTVLAMSADDVWFALAYEDGAVQLRELANPERVVFETGGTRDPTSLAISPNGSRLLAVGTASGTIEVWDATTGRRRAQYRRAHTHDVGALTFSVSGDRLISADVLQIKEWATEAEDAPADDESERIAGPIATAPDGMALVGVSIDGRCAIWDARTGSRRATSPTATPGISPCEGLRVTARTSGSIFQVLAWSRSRVQVWDGHSCEAIAGVDMNGVQHAGFGLDNSIVIAAGDALWLWRLSESAPVRLGEHRKVSHLAVSIEDHWVLTCGGDRAARLWNLDPPTPLELMVFKRMGIEGRTAAKTWSHFAPDKPGFTAVVDRASGLVATGDGTVVLIHLEGQQELTTLAPRHKSAVRSLFVSADGTSVVTGASDRIIVWDLDSLAARVDWSLPLTEIHQLSRDGTRVLMTTMDGVVKVVSLVNQTTIAGFQGDRQFIACAGGLDLEWIAAADEGGRVHVFHLEEQRALPDQSQAGAR